MIERICVFTAREDQALPRLCVITARHHHPRAEIVHITDAGTAPLKGADTVWRGEWDGSKDSIPMLRLRQLAANLDDRPTLLLDSDLLVCANADGIFAAEFDVALTWRVSKVSKYNAGVMFSRRAEFWQSFLRRMSRRRGYQTWNNEQVILDREAESGKWTVLDLPCSIWNNSEMLPDEPPPVAKILHYKGPRKAMMRDHFNSGVWQ